MNQRFYSIYDTKALAFAPPFLAANDQTAIRMVYGAAIDPNTDLAKFPGDYALVGLAEWDETNGQITTYEFQNNIGSVRMILASREDQSEPETPEPTSITAAKEN